MSATATQKPAELHELGHYTLPEKETRVLVGRRIDGEVFVYDHPREGDGRRYYVDSGFDSKAELAVMLADYRREAMRLGACPMSAEAIKRGFELAALA